MRTSIRVWVAAVLTVAFMLPVPVRATNDEYWPQWALTSIGVPAVWQVSRGAGVIVAVVDTGVDLGHPDLRGRLLQGKDFVDGDSHPQDENGHGTHMAGTVGAVTGNGIGIASVAPESKILPVRVLDANGQSDDPESVAAGIRWAVDHGARVVNLSLAQDSLTTPVVGSVDLLSDQSIDDAIRYVTQRGAVAVVAAGNTDGGGKPETAYTASSPGAIVVGAATRDDRRAAYSNYGAGLDVLGPGGGSATDPRFEKGCNTDNAIVGLYWDPKDERSWYAGACGTSVAVAHVSGVAALLMARGYTNAAAVTRIEQTARDLGAKGKDGQTGWGRVDAARALGAGPTIGRIDPSRAATAASPPPVRRITPAGGTVGGKPPTPRPFAAPAPPSPRHEAAPVGRGGAIGLAALLAMVVGFAQTEVRRRHPRRRLRM